MLEAGRRSAEAPEVEKSANVWSEYEIEARTSLTDRALRNLKHGDAFAVLDAHGDIGTARDTAEGLFYRDTRFLSHLELRLGGKRPLLLSSAIHADKAALSVELTNPDLEIAGEKLTRDTVFLQRTKFLWRGVCYERVSIRNYGDATCRLRLDLLFGADFHDLFEVRGMRRPQRGVCTARVVNPEQVEFSYGGLDGVERRTVIEVSPPPLAIDTHRMTFEMQLARDEQQALTLTVSCRAGAEKRPPPLSFMSAYRNTRRTRRAATAEIASVTTSNEAFSEMLSRAKSDVYTLVTWGPRGPYPYAGIPWFSTTFGRDGIITALLMLWVDPRIARGVLRTLAASQARNVDPHADAQPGKIIHEMRHGEMANLGEVPFARYYGAVDTTPLFVLLAGLYLDRTGDLATIEAIWPNIRAALRWIDEYGDCDGDGFVEYARAEASGLANQGWKDSHDAIFHADGSMASGPVALCEVQGYVFAAKQHGAAIARKLGDEKLALQLLLSADELRANFERMFWCEELKTYALALDGDKRACKVRASNAGHALFTGIATRQKAARVAATLLAPDMFSGWGVRTIASGQARYNPMSYHNGSIWPHDNALIAMGLARYGFKTEAARILSGIFDAGRHQDLSRLPELFCGFDRRPNRSPTPYPVACSPQAWSAASAFGLLGSCLGLELNFERNEILLRDPLLPDFLEEVAFSNLRLGASHADIRLRRHGPEITVDVQARGGDARVVVSK